ncbi:PI-PLC X domain-containing protein 1 [Rhipicephalus microplus]|uniref:PI-PLC X domain-containing protein 1 n=1 Tax=Rhipicephalus microplus TaxID=6941 RepID=UPI003F6D5D23
MIIVLSGQHVKVRSTGASMLASNIILLICGVCYGQTISGMRPTGVYLTISSYSNRGIKPFFEVNWFGMPQQYIGVVSAVLSTKNRPRSSSDILASQIVKNPTESYTTRIVAPNFNSTVLIEGRCLGYWALIMETSSAVKSSSTAKVLYSSCFTPQPRWMRDNCGTVFGLRLTDMLIPGTHNAGMYKAGPMAPHEQLIYDQDQSIWQQLAYGIRGLDLRVQFSRGDYYITHDVIRGKPTVREVLREVRDFVVRTGEVVLLDFHRFPRGFEKKRKIGTDRHKGLVKLIVTELEDVLLKGTDYIKTMGEILGGCSGRGRPQGRVLVFYNSREYQGPYQEYLAPGVSQKWPNAQSKSALMQYLETKACLRGVHYMIAIMAELTPKFPKFLISTRKLAKWINHKITEFFRLRQMKYSGIIATDYFLGNGITDVAIEANCLRGRQMLRNPNMGPRMQ